MHMSSKNRDRHVHTTTAEPPRQDTIRRSVEGVLWLPMIGGYRRAGRLAGASGGHNVEDLALPPDPRGSRFRAFTARDLAALADRGRIPAQQSLAMAAVAAVLPFRTNNYVVDELIDWSAVPDDPIFRLTFPQPDMLAPGDLKRAVDLIGRNASPAEVQRAVHEIRMRLNPHPDGQVDLNIPVHNGRPLVGVQHKYPQTVLVFPSQGQTCHAYCTYCFRWAQFVGEADLRMATNDVDAVVGYLRDHPEVTNVLITGGDALVMSAGVLRRYVDALLAVDTIETIRFGTKALSYWPYRWLTDRDADDLLRLFDSVIARGRHLAVMAHFSHPRELMTSAVQAAIRRIRSTGAIIRCQAPLIRGINDDAETWAELWTLTSRLGAVPYYMFVERDTGPQDYFPVPLARCSEIFRTAYAKVACITRPLRGPVMSASPRSTGRGCSSCTSSRPGCRNWWGGRSSHSTTRTRPG